MLPLMWLADRLADTRPILFVTVSVILLAFCILLYSGAYWFVLAGIVFFFMAFNLLEVMLPAQLSKLASAGSRGTAMGVYTTLQFLGIFAGGLVSGAILGTGVNSNLLYANIAICLLWLGLCLTFPRLGSISSRTSTESIE